MAPNRTRKTSGGPCTPRRSSNKLPPRLANLPTHQRKQLDHWRLLLSRRNLSISDASEDYTDYEDFPELEGRSSYSMDLDALMFWDERRMGEGAFERYKRLTAKLTPKRRITGWVGAQGQVTEYDPIDSPVKVTVRITKEIRLSLNTPAKLAAVRARAEQKMVMLASHQKQKIKENAPPRGRSSQRAAKVEPVRVDMARAGPMTRSRSRGGRSANVEPEVAPKPVVPQPQRFILATGPMKRKLSESSSDSSDSEDDPVPVNKKRRIAGPLAPKPRPNPARPVVMKKKLVPAVPVPAIVAPVVPKYNTRNAALVAGRVTRSKAVEVAAAKPNYKLTGAGLKQSKSKPNLALLTAPTAANKPIVNAEHRFCHGCEHLFSTRQALEKHTHGVRAKLACRA